MSDSKTIIITGSSGMVGSALVSYFSERGFRVRAFQRNLPEAKHPSVEYFKFDLNNVTDNGFAGAGYLVHCAYRPVISRRERESDSNIDIEAAEKIISTGRKNGIKLIFLSTTSADPGAKSYYARQKFIIENLFDGQKDLILRLGLVVGGSRGLFGRILTNIRAHKFIPLIGGSQLTQTLAINDLCRIIESGINKNITGRFAVAHPAPVSLKELYRTIAANIGARPIFIPVPYTLTYLAVRILEGAGAKLPFTAESILGIRDLKISDTSRDLKIFGITPVDYKTALSRMDNRL